MKINICLLVICIVLCSSCGTWINMDSPRFLGLGETYPYGGVAIDGISIFSPLIAFALLDLPFSFVGDTVTLPYILYKRPYCKDSDTSSSSWNVPLLLK